MHHYFIISYSLLKGSFFIPLFLIVFLYFKIFTTQQKVASRRERIKTNQGAKMDTTQVDVVSIYVKYVNKYRMNFNWI